MRRRGVVVEDEPEEENESSDKPLASHVGRVPLRAGLRRHAQSSRAIGFNLQAKNRLRTKRSKLRKQKPFEVEARAVSAVDGRHSRWDQEERRSVGCPDLSPCAGSSGEGQRACAGGKRVLGGSG